MSDIAELEQRITAALERIDTGVGELAQGGSADSAELEALKEALEAEKTANAQLEERVAAIKEKQDTTIREMEQRIEDLSAKLEEKEQETKRLIMVNAQLRENKETVNGAEDTAALQAELDALRQARKADLAEVENIMAELKPLIGEGG